MASPRRDEDGNVISYPDPADIPAGRGGSVPVAREKDLPRRRPRPPVGVVPGDDRKPSSGYGINNVNTLKGGNVTIGDVGSNNTTNVGSGRAEAKERAKKYKDKAEDAADSGVTTTEYDRGEPVANTPTGSSSGPGQDAEKPPSFVGDGMQSRDGVLRREANREARMAQRMENKTARQEERKAARQEERAERKTQRQESRSRTSRGNKPIEDPRDIFRQYRSQFDDPRRRNQPTGPISSSYNGGYSYR